MRLEDGFVPVLDEKELGEGKMKLVISRGHTGFVYQAKEDKSSL